ncbi:MAG: 30S ribosomal protein THX [Steroidobacteraceae bacterium]
MGRGDRRTRKGKIWRGSHGNTRPAGGKKKG